MGKSEWKLAPETCSFLNGGSGLVDNVRIISRLDIKLDRLIKGIQLEGWRPIGAPNEIARQYYEQNIDELIYVDAVASLYSRDMLLDIVRDTTKDIFIPLTVGGGIRTVDDAAVLLRSGADKICANTGCHQNPQLIDDVANKFGSQCMVVYIEALRRNPGRWDCFMDCSREPTGKDVVAWAKEAVDRGAGEILLTSIDQEGTGKGFDIELVQAVAATVNVPVIANGGFGKLEHFYSAIHDGKADAVCISSAFHYGRIPIESVRQYALENGIPVRQI